MRAIRTTSLFMCRNTDSIVEITIGCPLSRSILFSRSAGLRRISRRKNRLQRSAYAFCHRRISARRIVRISSYISVLRANFQHTCRGVHHRNIQRFRARCASVCSPRIRRVFAAYRGRTRSREQFPVRSPTSRTCAGWQRSDVSTRRPTNANSATRIGERMQTTIASHTRRR